jgi:small subunit ribosomal protein S15
MQRGRASRAAGGVKESPAWVQLKNDEIESLVVKLSGTGLTSAQIGQKLRDSYGVPDVRLATGKTVVKIMKEKGVKIDIPEDVTSLMKRAVHLQTHLKSNPADLSNKRSLELVESRIRRLQRYYKREGVIPQDWDYKVMLAEIGSE